VETPLGVLTGGGGTIRGSQRGGYTVRGSNRGGDLKQINGSLVGFKNC